MPTWQPNWSDVQFDHAAVDAARTECESARDLLDESLAWLRGPMHEVRTDWSGRARRAFELESSSIRTAAGQARSDLDRLLRDLEAADQAARDEQANRERERQRWRDQRDAEQRRLLQGPR